MSCRLNRRQQAMEKCLRAAMEAPSAANHRLFERMGSATAVVLESEAETVLRRRQREPHFGGAGHVSRCC